MLVLNFVYVKVKLSSFLIKHNMKIYGTVMEVHFHTSTLRRWEKQPPNAPCFHPRISLDSVQKRKISAISGAANS
jgi:hypothetical protein